INKKVEDFLSSIKNEEDFLLFQLAFNHEYQHQELLVYDVQNLLANSYHPVKQNNAPIPSPVEKNAIMIYGGLFEMGYPGLDFCYDIELPEHTIYLNSYLMDTFPVTNGDYLKFITDGGYENFRFWLSDGWEKVKKEGWIAPMYWEKEEEQWVRHDFRGKHKINLNEPV
ncbi:MAG: SUMF1/EgtB/PvdO family nonheme iron enzyme, partial [Thaumarchaeota archaeon]|nr:SUMF1/EgtB/PvdO family nonheme iron enzyme [Nitrososphaerota archaeon]